jgi:hypothetical protein
MSRFWTMLCMSACVLALAGCGTQVAFTPLNAPPHPLAPKIPAQIEVFDSGPPARAHVDVGSFIITGLGTNRTGSDYRTAAANRGCDGVVVLHGDPDRGVCIVYSDSAKQ